MRPQLSRRALPLLAATLTAFGAAATSAEAANVSVANGTVTYAPANGESQVNRLVLDGATAGSVRITDNEGNLIQPVPPCTAVGAVAPATTSNVVSCPGSLGAITATNVDTGALADTVSFTNWPAAIATNAVTGGAGDDVLRSPDVGATVNTLTGDAGDDTLTGGAGGDRVQGGAGADTLRAGSAGLDTVLYTDKAAGLAVVVTMGGTDTNDGVGCASEATCERDSVQDGFENYTGGAADDTVTGTAADNVLNLAGGNNAGQGGDGADELDGTTGNDTFFGQDGNDRLLAGAGNNVLSGGPGNDELTTTTGNDTLTGDAGDDTLSSGDGTNTLDGLDGTDSLTGGANADTLTGGFGNDVLAGAAGTDTIRYDDHTDPATTLAVDLGAAPQSAVLTAPAETDTPSGIENVVGSAGADRLRGADAVNALDGGPGDDTLDGGPETAATLRADTFRGGAGTDTVTYETRPANAGNATADNLLLTLDGAANDGASAGTEGDNIDADGSVEIVKAGLANDTVTGSPRADTLFGGGGNDTLSGLAGTDTLTGDAGNDTLLGGDDADTLSGSAGADTLDGGAGNDTLDGGADTDTASFASRTTGVTASLAAGTATQGAETDTLTAFENLTGGSGNDLLTGSDVANVINGGPGLDVLDGGKGGDTLVGGADQDVTDYSAPAPARTAGVTVTLDNVANDGSTADDAAGDNVQTEDVTGTELDDTLTDVLGGPTVLRGNGGADSLDGGPGSDMLFGGAGNDSLDGSADDDTLDGGLGADVLAGAAGTNTASYAGRTEAITVDLALGSTALQGAADEGDRLSGVANLIGGQGDDVLSGTAGVNRLTGGLGDDTLDGRLGADVLTGEAGGDTVLYATRTAAVKVDLTDAAADQGEGCPAATGCEGDQLLTLENVTSGSGPDVLTGDPATQNVLRANAGDDTLTTRDGLADTADCGPGTDVSTGDPLDTFIACEAPDKGPLSSVSIADQTVTEGDAGSADATFILTLSAPQAYPTTVVAATADGTATAGSDYTAQSVTVTFAPGTTTQTVAVPVTGDTAVEPDEGFEVRLSGATNLDVADGTGAGTITNDDASISIDDVVTTEGDAGSKDAVFTVTRTGAKQAVSFTAQTGAPATATAGTDYTAVTASPRTIAAGDPSTTTITVPIIGDTLVEGDETYSVLLSAVTGATLADGTGTGTISDDDAAPSVTVAPASKPEDASPLTFTVTLSRAYPTPLTLNFATSIAADDTATAGDFTATSGTLTIPAGQTSATIPVTLSADTVVEPDETFTLTLTDDATSAPVAPGSPRIVKGTIVNDDATISIEDAPSSNEGNSATRSATFLVRRTGAAKAITFGVRTDNGTAEAPSDYTALPANATGSIAADQTVTAVLVQVRGDTLVELDEAFTATISNPTGATLGAKTSGTTTIVNDDTLPTVAIEDAPAVAEGNAGTTKDAPFTVRLSRAYGEAVTVQYATANGTATAPGDFTATPGAVTIPAGQTTGTFTVPVVGDGLVEPDETFTATISAPTNATLGTKTSGTGTITNDDTAPVVSVGDAPAVAENGPGTATFRITLDRPAAEPVAVPYATADGTATQPSDYTQTTGTAMIAAGGSAATVEVPVIGDGVVEPDEAFTLTLGEPTGATRGTRTGTATITNDDVAAPAPGPGPGPVPPVLSLSVADLRVTEGNAGTTDATFTVTLAGASERTVTVDAGTVDGTATKGSDYATTTSKLTFASGETRKAFTVKVTGDAVAEPDETFGVLLANASGASIADGAAVATVVNDDTATTGTRKVRPTLKASLTKRDRTAPFAFTTKGTLRLPAGTAKSACKGGKVRIELKKGKKLISRRTVTLTSACAFTSRVRFNTAKAAGGRGTLKATVRFLGTPALLRVTSTGTARVG